MKNYRSARKLLSAITVGLIVINAYFYAKFEEVVYAEPTAWNEVDTFESLSNGAINGRNGWSAEQVAVVNSDPTDPSNKVLQISNDASDEFARKAFPSAIGSSSTGTLFFRMYRDSSVDVFAGATDSPNANSFTFFKAQLGKRPADGNNWTVRDGGNFRASTNGNGFPEDQWLCVWMKIDNANDQFEVYVQGDAYPTATALTTSAGSTFNFRTTATPSISHFFVMKGAEGGNFMYFDDIFVESSTSGTNLSTPSGVSCSAQPPEVINPGQQVTLLGSPVSLFVNATNLGGGNLVYSASALPGGLSINSSTGEISGTPNTPGTFNVTLSVENDNDLRDSTSFDWVINQAPVIVNPGNQLAEVGVGISIDIDGSDPDGDIFGYNATGLPPGIINNNEHSEFFGSPTTVGDFESTIYLLDQWGATSEEISVIWRIYEVNGELQENVSQNINGGEKSNQVYFLDVPSGASNLSFEISGGTGDADIYVRHDQVPSIDNYDCRPFLDGSNETCLIDNPSAGRYFALINGFQAFSGVTLVGSYDLDATPTPIPTETPLPTNTPVPTPTAIPSETPSAPSGCNPECSIFLATIFDNALSPSCLLLDIDPNNDGSATASQNGRICTDGREIEGFASRGSDTFDVYSLRLSDRTDISVRLESQNSSGANLIISLWGANGSVIESRGDTSAAKEISREMAAGNYFIVIEATQGASAYLLSVEEN